MLNVLKKIYDRYFHDEEAVILLFLIFGFLLVMLFMGGILAPVIAAPRPRIFITRCCFEISKFWFIASFFCFNKLYFINFRFGDRSRILMPLVLDQLSNLGGIFHRLYKLYKIIYKGCRKVIHHSYPLHK